MLRFSVPKHSSNRLEWVFLSIRGYISEGKFWMNKVQINRLDNIHFKLIVLHKVEKSRSPNHDRQSILLPIPAVSVSIVKVILHEQPGLLFTSIWREVWNIVFIPVIWILRRWILHKFKIKWKLVSTRVRKVIRLFEIPLT